ncbi:MAG: hypothetical protein GPJ51_11315 [Candidatus Heimdallarchaeota archaeon]|nr:hypothetical protein [Candidatus Heimdallarchaeota archaeon]
MSGWAIFLAIFGGFLVLLVIGYIIYYKNHKVSRESQPRQSTDQLDNVEEVTKRETFRERAKQFFRGHP